MYTIHDIFKCLWGWQKYPNLIYLIKFEGYLFNRSDPLPNSLNLDLINKYLMDFGSPLGFTLNSFG